VQIPPEGIGCTSYICGDAPLERFFTQSIKIKDYETLATIDRELWEIDEIWIESSIAASRFRTTALPAAPRPEETRARYLSPA
jgi:hypothetical protein